MEFIRLLDGVGGIGWSKMDWMEERRLVGLEGIGWSRRDWME